VDITAYIFGYCVCWINILVWTAYFDRYPPSGGFPTRVFWWSLRISDTRGRILRQIIQLMLIPVAFLMSVGPLSTPPVSLALAQQVSLAYTPEITISC
jgi:hypothetical protein